MGSTSYTLVDGELLAEYRQGSERDYVGDALGSTVALLDGSQQFTDRWTYWPYGEERTRTGATPTPFRFVGIWGYYQDAAASLYVRARYYRPGLGRWQTVDPLWWGRPGGRETYQYCDASPVGTNDPSGLQPAQNLIPKIEGCDGARTAFLRSAFASICASAQRTDFVPGFDGECRQKCRPCHIQGVPPEECFRDLCSSSRLTIVCEKDNSSTCSAKPPKGHRTVCAEGNPATGRLTICNRAWAGPKGPAKCDFPGCQILHEMLHLCGNLHRGTPQDNIACWDCYRKAWPACEPYKP